MYTDIKTKAKTTKTTPRKKSEWAKSQAETGVHTKRAGSLGQTYRTGIYEKGNDILEWAEEKGHTRVRKCEIEQTPQIEFSFKTLSLTYLFLFSI